MKSIDVFSIAHHFRTAILAAKTNNEFHYRDRMYNFPGGCCDDSCDLLAYYLNATHSIQTMQGNGTYRDSDPNNTTNHAWLIMEDNIIIDITIDQFAFVSTEYSEGVYVGKENSFYRHLERKQIDRNYDITHDDRLWKDYNIIVSYIK